MRTANVQRQSDRRTEILDAAERCFSRLGFHQASMQVICAEAGMSPGNLYRYFPSKEAIIAGIAERNRAEAAANFAAAGKVDDFFGGLANLARHYLVERSPEEIGLCAEIMAESRRNPEIARIYGNVDKDVRAGLVGILRGAAECGEISPDLDLERAVICILALGDGIEWRRAVDPSFDPETVLPMVLKMVECLLTHPPAGQANETEKPR
jgi:AcrR family transcriptional regulator